MPLGGFLLAWPFGQWLLGSWVSELGRPLDDQLAAALVGVTFGLRAWHPGGTAVRGPEGPQVQGRTGPSPLLPRSADPEAGVGSAPRGVEPRKAGTR